MNITPYLDAGYKKVPGEPYLVHRSLESVYLIEADQLVSLPIETLVYRIIKDVANGSIRVLHRLRALAHIPIPDSIPNDKAICNHKDGNKLNNEIPNLEWTTYSGNNRHAVMEGLRPDNLTGTCHDIITGTRYEFYSLWHLSSMINLHAGMMSRYIKETRDYPFKNRYNIKVLGRTTKYDFTLNDIWKSGPGSPTPIVLLDTETGIKTYWGTFTNMVRKMGKNWVHKKKLIPGKIVKFENGRYEMVIATTYLDISKGHKENETWAKLCSAGISGYFRPGRKVSAVNNLGVESIFNDLRSCSIGLALPYPSLKKALSKRKETYKGYKFKYL